MTRDELIDKLRAQREHADDWRTDLCELSSSMLQRDGETIAALEAERDRLKAALSKSKQTAERWRAYCMYFWSIS